MACSLTTRVDTSDTASLALGTSRHEAIAALLERLAVVTGFLGLGTHNRSHWSLRTVEGLVDLSFAILLLLCDLDNLLSGLLVRHVLTVEHESDEELCRAGGEGTYAGR